MQIDFTRLSRNYELNPLKRTEPIPKEDLKYLFKELLLSYPEIEKIIGKKTDTIIKSCKHYNIIRTPEEKKIIRKRAAELARKRSIEKYGVANPMQRPEVKEKLRKTNIEKYGVDNPFKNKEIRQKQKNTMMERYGVEYPANSPLIRSKQIQSHLDKHGVKYPFQNPDSLQKFKNTCMKRYGVDSAMKSEKGKQLLKNSFLEKYGVDNPMKSEDIKNKLKQNNLEKYGYESTFAVPEFIEKRKETCIEKYGVDNPSKAEVIKEKKKKTCLSHYGVESPMQDPEIAKRTSNSLKSLLIQNKKRINNLMKYGIAPKMNIKDYSLYTEDYCKYNYGYSNYNDIPEVKNRISEKIYKTKKQNNSITKSSPEDRCYEKLLEKFPQTIHQYRSNEYPFNCDFYIPELELYIEYQGHPGHGGEPFDETNKKHILKLQKWSQKSKEINFKGHPKLRYLEWIQCWTISDPLKRQTAKQNNLNWLEFFTEKQFEEWYNNL